VEDRLRGPFAVRGSTVVGGFILIVLDKDGFVVDGFIGFAIAVSP